MIKHAEESGCSDEGIRLRALCSASDGDVEETERALSSSQAVLSSTEGLDLQARIAIARGQNERARQLWKEVLKREPENAAAREALDAMASGWRARALARRLLVLAVLGISGALSVVGLVALAFGPSLNYSTGTAVARPSIVVVTNVIAAATGAVTATTKPEGTSGLMEENATEPGPASRLPIEISSVPGFSIKNDEGQLQIIPDDALFTYRCELATSAWTRIEALAAELGKIGSNVLIVVEGHTDSSPMPPNSSFRDNYQLGFKRAFVVSEILMESARFPVGSVMVTSAGDSRPPFADEPPVADSRNRTVVVRIMEKDPLGKGR